MKTKYFATQALRVMLKGGEVTVIPPSGIIAFEPAKVEKFVESGKLRPLSTVENMSLEDFGKTRMALKITAPDFGGDFCLASDEDTAEQLKKEGFVCYTVKELQTLFSKKLHPEDLKVIHKVKAVFPRSIIVH